MVEERSAIQEGLVLITVGAVTCFSFLFGPHICYQKSSTNRLPLEYHELNHVI